MPHTEKRRKTASVYTKNELHSLRQLTMHTQNSLYQDNRMSLFMDKSVWTEIANRMHAMGHPKRSWISLRIKGLQLLSETSTYYSHTTQNLCGLKMFSGSGLPTPQNKFLLHPLREHGDQVSMWNFQPPPLIPSSEACAKSLSASNSGASPPRMQPCGAPIKFDSHHSLAKLGEANIPAYIGSPALAQSVQVLPTFTELTDTDNRSSKSQSATLFELLRLPDSDDPYHIDLSISHDEGDDKWTDVERSSRETATPMSLTATCTRFGCPDGPGASTQGNSDQAQLEMQVYRKKLEVLEVKKMYWMEKLKRLQKHQGSDSSELSGV
ncbi:hypothetical protein CSKR_201507 [Clonorchis sinensis]|uniref:Myb/SANT-like DNA-binding domain-containing protein n=1 Tax=Clonorchis sinensis TaxID=79923 RepID=A0A8T1MS99_CLOSI|nr:hypothetical protein CSKR_201507 [Clonorchis sinensis]